MTSLDSFKCRKTLKVGGKTYHYFRLKAAEKNGLEGVSKLPYSMKVLLENLLRYEDGRSVTKDDIRRRRRMAEEQGHGREGNRLPPGARADAGFHRRAGGGRSGRDARRHARRSAAIRKRSIRWSPVDLVIDHSVMVDNFGSKTALKKNVEHRIRAQWRALRLPALGPGRLRQFPRRAARHRHLPPGQSRISGPDRLDAQGEMTARGKRD